MGNMTKSITVNVRKQNFVNFFFGDIHIEYELNII